MALHSTISVHYCFQIKVYFRRISVTTSTQVFYKFGCRHDQVCWCVLSLSTVLSRHGGYTLYILNM